MMHARTLGLALFNISAALVTVGGVYDLTLPTLPEHVATYLSAPDTQPDERTARLVLAIFHALGAALTAVGLAALVLINGPVRRGSKPVLLATVAMIVFVEGVNAWGMWTVSAPWWAPLSFIALAMAGSVLLFVSSRPKSVPPPPATP